MKLLIAAPSVKTGSKFTDANFKEIKAFYSTRSFKPVWSRDSGPKGKAKALLAELQASEVHGLSPNNYNTAEISQLMNSKDPADLARMDFLFTGALVEFAHDLLNGRTTNLRSYDLNRVEPVRLDPASLVEKAAAAGNLRTMLGEIVGDDRRYLRLVAKMLEFKRLNNPEIWPAEISSNDIKALRRILALTGDLPFDKMKSDAGMDDDLSAAIASYQSRHGLEVDGKLGDKTLEQINQPMGERIRKIKLNLERRRWQNKSFDQKLLYLNLVDGQLKLLENDKTQAQLEVFPNEQYELLPTFYGKITHVERMGSGQSAKVRLTFNGAAAGTGTIDLDDGNGKAFELVEKAVSAADRKNVSILTSSGGAMPMLIPTNLLVTYLTVWATRDGKIQFRPDIYKRDAKLTEKLGL